MLAAFLVVGVAGCGSDSAPTTTARTPPMIVLDATNPTTLAPTSVATRQPCGRSPGSVVVEFVRAVQAHDVGVYTACESVRSPPGADRIDTLAGFGPLIL